MPIPYNGLWFYPPRSGNRVPYKDSPVLRMWKRYSDAVAQWKMNGTNTQLKVFPDQRIELWQRHRFGSDRKPSATGTPLQVANYTLPQSVRDEVLSLTPKGVFTIYNVELLHAKTPTVKNTLYFFDVLVWEGQHLLGVTYHDRYRILDKIMGQRPMPLDMQKCDGKLYLADNMPSSKWDAAWEAAKASAYCEGLVLKRLGSVSALQVGSVQQNNGGFMCRIRKAMKNARY